MRPFIFSAAVVAVVGLAPRAQGAGDAPGAETPKVDPCTLLTVADAQKIAKVPLKVRPQGPYSMKPGQMCTYEQAGPGNGRRIFVALEILNQEEWNIMRAGILGKLETGGMKGIGDESYFTRTPQSKLLAAELTFFVRKGQRMFSMKATDLGTEPTDAMKAPLKKIAG